MALPTLSDADRQKALKKAAEARQKRAALRAEIKSGKLSFAHACATALVAIPAPESRAAY